MLRNAVLEDILVLVKARELRYIDFELCHIVFCFNVKEADSMELLFTGASEDANATYVTMLIPLTNKSYSFASLRY